MAVKIFGIVLLLLIAVNCSEEPPVVTPPPVDDTIKNTITISVEWQELTAIALSWNKSLIDTQSTFTYNLKRRDPTGDETEFNTGQDTAFIDDNEGNGLDEGTNYSYKLEASVNSKTIDTSSTIITNTLTTTSHDIIWQLDTLGQPNNFLNDVWGIDENNVWAVGAINMPEGITSVIKWDGTNWFYHSWPEGGASAIWEYSKNDIWIVGEYSNRGLKFLELLFLRAKCSFWFTNLRLI